ncbi:hypothetical protein C492_00160 [Natronococcus jeotgali DSM 18795]|uniref:Uncharacterized protein n=1 Tax=Natronococcus jeotgali DSM 18795 TaxID=1227498 RepID=L9Y002_9EURY|nr:hypothetical protein C492_00160 [Natronococcus jeotgali DSM 18795]
MTPSSIVISIVLTSQIEFQFLRKTVVYWLILIGELATVFRDKLVEERSKDRLLLLIRFEREVLTGIFIDFEFELEA